jgi:hypothetical protein
MKTSEVNSARPRLPFRGVRTASTLVFPRPPGGWPTDIHGIAHGIVGGYRWLIGWLVGLLRTVFFLPFRSHRSIIPETIYRTSASTLFSEDGLNGPMTDDMPKGKRNTGIEFDPVRLAASMVKVPGSELLIPAAAAPQPIELWQLVVTGNIDARQHHPLWYHIIECINKDELEYAKQTLVAVGLPTVVGQATMSQTSMCQFDAGPFSVITVADKWTIQTAKRENCGRMINVASVVFKKLNELYVSAYGVNKLFDLKLSSTTSGQFLSDRISSAGLAIKKGKGSGQITHTQNLNGSDVLIQLSQSPTGDRWLHVLHNRHHPLVYDEAKYIDLGELLNQNAESDWSSASQYGSELAEQLAHAEGMAHGE